MKYKFEVCIVVIETNDESDNFDLKINDESVDEYIVKRDTLFDDKIYPDENKLTVMKTKHNSQWKNLTTNLKKRVYFKMTNCDKAVKKAVEPLLTEISELKTINNTRDKESLELKNESLTLKNELEKQKRKSEELEKQVLLLLKSANLI